MAMGDLLTPGHLILVLVVALLIFGPRRLPEFGSAIGRTIREFQKSMREATEAISGPKDEGPKQSEPTSKGGSA